MFVIVADLHDSPLELSVRRARFQAGSFSHSIAADERRGTVHLQPEGRELRIGSAPEDYERVRVFSADGTLVGTMARSADDKVRWIVPVSR
jgi:hypothetical protein